MSGGAVAVGGGCANWWPFRSEERPITLRVCFALFLLISLAPVTGALGQEDREEAPAAAAPPFNIAMAVLTIVDLGADFVLDSQLVQSHAIGEIHVVGYTRSDPIGILLGSGPIGVEVDVIRLSGERPRPISESLRNAITDGYRGQGAVLTNFEGPAVGRNQSWYTGSSDERPGLVSYLVVFDTTDNLAAVAATGWEDRVDADNTAAIARLVASRLEG